MNKAFFELSNPQNSIWVTEQFYNNTNINNICGIFHFNAKIDVEILKKSINLLIKQNDALRLRMVLKDLKPMQYVSDFENFAIPVVQVKSDEDLNELKQKMATDVIDIIDAPLFRFTIFQFPNGVGGYVVTVHHLASDALTLGLIGNKTYEIYQHLIRQEKIEDSKFSYIDYLEAEKNYLESEKFVKDESFWNDLYSTVPEVATIPATLQNNTENFHAKREVFSISKENTDQIKQYCKEHKISLYHFFMAIFSLYIGRVSNLDNFVVGTPILNRTNFKEKNTLGMFISNLPFRVTINPNQTFAEYVSTIAVRLTTMLRHQRYPYQYLLENLRKKDSSLPNLYNITLSYQITKASASGSGCQTDWIPSDNIADDMQIHFYDLDYNGNINIAYDYRTSKYEKEEINNIQQRLEHIIDQILVNNNLVMKNVEIVTPKEKHQILYDFNNTKTDYPKDKTIVELFEEQVEKTPNHIAVVFENQKLTYKELNEKANSLAHYMFETGVHENDVIALFIDKSLEALISILAILKCGCAYLPVDIDYPEERIHFMLKDSNAKMVLTTSKYNEKLNTDTSTICINSFDFSCYSNTNPILTINNSNSLAYIMYTSGSTGTPKGVMISNKNVVRLVKNSNYIKFEEGDRILQTGSIVFDACTFEIWGALLNGLELYLLKKEDLLNPLYFSNYLKEHKISSLFLTTALFNKFCEENAKMFNGLKYLLTGGEAVSMKHMEIAKNNNPRLNLVHVYGPTENTTFSTYFPVHSISNTIPIGFPIANSTSYVVSAQGSLQPIGTPGELWVGGDGVGQGYLNRENLNSEKFIKNPFGKGKIYKTGDLVKCLSDGSIDFIGRIDNQVKIRGFRIELSGIDSKILTYPGIKESITIVNTVANVKTICSYIVSDNNVSVPELKNFLLQSLASYMVPTYIIPMKQLPLTINGKIDRKLLPAPTLDKKSSAITPARNTIDSIIIETLNQILGINNISIDESFIDLGVDSLIAINLSTILSDKLNLSLSIKDIMNANNIKELSDSINALTAKTSYHHISITPSQKYYPLSSAQKRIYLATSKTDSSSLIYNVPIALLIDSILDEKKVKKSFNQLIKLHSSFRTSFQIIDGEVKQVISDNIHIKIDIFHSKEKNIDNILSSFSKPFDLSKAPLLKIALHYLDDKKTLILIDSHHIILDGTSLKILLDDFCKLYENSNITPNTLEYKDFSVWENRFVHSSAIKDLENYWNTQLNDYDSSVIDLPYDFPIPSNPSYSGEKVSIKLSEDLFHSLENLAKKLNLSPYMLFLSMFYILLYKYTGNNEIIVGSPVLGRENPELKNIIGMFVNNLVLRAHIDSDLSFLEFSHKVKDIVLDGIEHSSYPYDLLVKKLKISSAFDVLFSYQNFTLETNTINDTFIEILNVPTNTSKFNLSVEIVPTLYTINVEYSTELFKKSTITHLMEHYINILKNINANINTPIKNIQIISDSEKTKLLHEFNHPVDPSFHFATIMDLFDKQTMKTPNELALVFEDQSLTYQQLNEKANMLSHYLKNNGIHRNDIIGILLNRSCELIICMLAVLKSGACYIPIDPTYPEDRIKYMLDNSEAKLLLTNEKTSSNINFKNKILIDLESMDKYTNNIANPNYVNEPDDLSYIIYTSGSTGFPKGVALRHISLTNLTYDLNSHTEFLLDTCQSKNIVSLTTASFDIFIFETLICLQKGLTIILANEEEQRIPAKLNILLEKNKVEIIQLTPSRMQILLDNIQYIPYLSNIKYVILAGEPLPNELLKKLLDLGVKKVYNGYGPSETTVFASFTDVTNSPIVTIGKPISNTQMYILDKDENLLPPGLPGELYISGLGVAKGYLNNFKLTNDRFLKDPFSNDSIMYKTGDSCKYSDSGDLLYLGRIDDQIKIRGLRIEIGEIESKILEFPYIKQVKVIKQKLENREFLSAYFIAHKRIKISELRKFLSESLPNYMIPSYFTPMDEFPHTPNGKIDKNSFPLPKSINSLNRQKYIAPKTDLQIKLVNIFEKVLNTKPIGIMDDFFELGGDSVLAMQLDIELLNIYDKIKYSDIFSFPTVSALAKKIESNATDFTENENAMLQTKYNNILDNNVILNSIPTYKSTGNLLLTGVTGYLGIHILDSFLKNESGNVYCLIRKEPGITAKTKFMDKLNYYFGDKYKDLLNKRIFIVTCDITREQLGLSQNDLLELSNNIDVVINSAAKVSHYGTYKDFYDINIKAVNHLLTFCKNFNKRFYHISTLSVSGNSFVDQYFEKQNFETSIDFTEDKLYINQSLENLYIKSKFEAEKHILEAISQGLDGYILRIGNLMPRISDGTFQENANDNAYINRLIAFFKIGSVPDYIMDAYLEFTPVDCTADSIVKIIQYPTKHNRIFHLFNHNHVPATEFTETLSNLNCDIKIVDNTTFKNIVKSIIKTKNIPAVNNLLNDFDENFNLSYDSKINLNSHFTIEYLDKINFHWPQITSQYIKYIVELLKKG